MAPKSVSHSEGAFTGDMGTRAKDKFNRRFSAGIRILYNRKPISVAEHDLLVAGIRKAVDEVLAGLLGRAPRDEELLGIKPIQKDEQKRIITIL